MKTETTNKQAARNTMWVANRIQHFLFPLDFVFKQFQILLILHETESRSRLIDRCLMSWRLIEFKFLSSFCLFCAIYVWNEASKRKSESRWWFLYRARITTLTYFQALTKDLLLSFDKFSKHLKHTTKMTILDARAFRGPRDTIHWFRFWGWKVKEKQMNRNFVEMEPVNGKEVSSDCH